MRRLSVQSRCKGEGGLAEEPGWDLSCCAHREKCTRPQRATWGPTLSTGDQGGPWGWGNLERNSSSRELRTLLCHVRGDNTGEKVKGQGLVLRKDWLRGRPSSFSSEEAGKKGQDQLWSLVSRHTCQQVSGRSYSRKSSSSLEGDNGNGNDPTQQLTEFRQGFENDNIRQNLSPPSLRPTPVLISPSLIKGTHIDKKNLIVLQVTRKLRPVKANQATSEQRV